MIARSRRTTWLLAIGALLCMDLHGSSACAEGDPAAVAEALFRSGRQLMAQGNYAEACPKFAESNRIDPKLGTLLNLAQCHEHTGKTATAWAEYVRAGETAARLGQAQRELVARERAAALEPTLPHVVIEAAATPGLAVMLDEQPIGAGAFSTAIPVDPGDHVVRATAPDKKPFVESFALQAGPAGRTVRVSFLDAETPVPTPAAATPRGDSASESSATVKGSPARRTWGWVIGGAGVAMVGVGAYFGIHAFSMKSTAESECDAAGACTPAGNDAMSSMKTSETISTVSFLAGAAAVGVGAYLVLSAGGPSASSPPTAALRVAPERGGTAVRMELTW
jgi:hypothetical protein